MKNKQPIDKQVSFNFELVPLQKPDLELKPKCDVISFPTQTKKSLTFREKVKMDLMQNHVIID